MLTAVYSAFNRLLWELYALGYETLNLSISHKRIRTYVRKEIAEHTDKPEVLIDAGCGSGTLLLQLADKYPQTKIIGVDFSSLMIFLTYIKAIIGGRKNVKLYNQSLLVKTPIETGIADYIVCVNTLFALNNPPFVLKEFHRILKPKSRLLIVTPKITYDYAELIKENWQYFSEQNPLKQLFIAIVFVILLPFLLIVFLANFVISQQESKGTYNQFDETRLEKLIEETGFRLLKLESIASDQEYVLICEKD